MGCLLFLCPTPRFSWNVSVLGSFGALTQLAHGGAFPAWRGILATWNVKGSVPFNPSSQRDVMPDSPTIFFEAYRVQILVSVAVILVASGTLVMIIPAASVMGGNSSAGSVDFVFASPNAMWILATPLIPLVAASIAPWAWLRRHLAFRRAAGDVLGERSGSSSRSARGPNEENEASTSDGSPTFRETRRPGLSRLIVSGRAQARVGAGLAAAVTVGFATVAASSAGTFAASLWVFMGAAWLAASAPLCAAAVDARWVARWGEEKLRELDRPTPG